MKKQSLLFILIAFAFLGINSSYAQVRLPQPSPTAKIIQNYGLSDVTLDYSRPSLRGRSFGEGNLDYYGKFWRTGANAPTNIAFGSDVSINGQKLSAGKYGLYTLPGKEEWTVVFSKNTGVTNAENYKPEENALTLKIKPENHPATETFTIDFTDFSSNSMTMALKWDKFRVPVKIEANVKEQVLSNTDKEVGNFANSLTQVANYALENNELERGQKWINKSIALQENFMNLFVKSKYLANEGSYAEAVKTAENSLNLAKEAKNDFYVSENEKNIKEWSSLKGKKSKK